MGPGPPGLLRAAPRGARLWGSGGGGGLWCGTRPHRTRSGEAAEPRPGPVPGCPGLGGLGGGGGSPRGPGASAPSPQPPARYLRRERGNSGDPRSPGRREPSRDVQRGTGKGQRLEISRAKGVKFEFQGAKIL
uniref:Uncharacterized protein LOC110223521 n=1 Tax=Phascolarctos cinereus TaxID=38626 RepID=A0A6P5M2B1_PHACI|nr:uncharacterized protein LOC110223521 [Phascolarctos cinereus]